MHNDLQEVVSCQDRLIDNSSLAGIISHAEEVINEDREGDLFVPRLEIAVVPQSVALDLVGGKGAACRDASTRPLSKNRLLPQD